MNNNELGSNMRYLIVIKKRHLYPIAIAVALIFMISFIKVVPAFSKSTIDEDIVKVVENIFRARSQATLQKDFELMDSLYDTKAKLSLWAYEHEEKKIKYLHNWAEKQGVTFTAINPEIKVRSMKKSGNTYSMYLICSTEYKYHYQNAVEVTNTFRIGTYHTLSITDRDGQWWITKEWYTDPFADSLNLDNIKYQDAKEFIMNHEAKDLSSLSQRRITTVKYLEQYCGAASEPQYNFSYNKKYRDYNPQGGDCANFASQALLEGGKFKKTSAWNYDKSGATKAWLNADGFSDYLIYSGRGSLITKGSYDKVYKSAYKLLPGDIVAYEKGGRITHVSAVSAIDSKGYPLVTCHNTDRNRVPWDLGWSNKSIKFWFIRVNY
jgi:hypothetical protein